MVYVPPQEEVTIQAGVSVGKIGTIKVFKGETPPLLKKGELATDGKNILLKSSDGSISKFKPVESLIEILVDRMREHINNEHQQ